MLSAGEVELIASCRAQQGHQQGTIGPRRTRCTSLIRAAGLKYLIDQAMQMKRVRPHRKPLSRAPNGRPTGDLHCAALALREATGGSLDPLICLFAPFYQPLCRDTPKATRASEACKTWHSEQGFGEVQGRKLLQICIVHLDAPIRLM